VWISVPTVTTAGPSWLPSSTGGGGGGGGSGVTTSKKSLSMLIVTPPSISGHLSSWPPRYCLMRWWLGQSVAGITGSETVAFPSQRANQTWSGRTKAVLSYTPSRSLIPESALE
jgi:hypothetical protein